MCQVGWSWLELGGIESSWAQFRHSKQGGTPSIGGAIPPHWGSCYYVPLPPIHATNSEKAFLKTSILFFFSYTIFFLGLKKVSRLLMVSLYLM
jgi:hypothetical protein